jgi:hypothetical protein
VVEVSAYGNLILTETFAYITVSWEDIGRSAFWKIVTYVPPKRLLTIYKTAHGFTFQKKGEKSYPRNRPWIPVRL